MAPPIPQLTINTNRLGGFLPRKLQQQWKKLIAIHHLILKTIYIVKNEPNWRNHPILQNLSNTRTPSVSLPNIPHTIWLQEIATVRKNTQIDTKTKIAKHSRRSAQKEISKFQKLISIKPKQGNKAIFQNCENQPLDSLIDHNNNIIIHPIDIADEIFVQQSKINALTIKTCRHQPQHHSDYTCQIGQYP
jgi:hypothetical protein